MLGRNEQSLILLMLDMATSLKHATHGRALPRTVSSIELQPGNPRTERLS